MAEYAMLVGGSISTTAGAAGRWASANEAVMFVAATVVAFFVLYKIFMRK